MRWVDDNQREIMLEECFDGIEREVSIGASPPLP